MQNQVCPITSIVILILLGGGIFSEEAKAEAGIVVIISLGDKSCLIAHDSSGVW
jgi:hypothetical protein